MATSERTATDRFTVPVGPGGILGRIGRIVIMFCTAGFVFPNAMVEGMNATAIDGRFSPKDAK